MTAAITDKFTGAFNSANPNIARVTVTRTAGAASLSCDNLAGWPTATAVHFSTYKLNTSNAVVAGSQIDWKGIVSGNTIGTLTRKAGATDAGSAIGDVVEMNPTGSWEQDLMDGITAQHNQDGTHGAVTATSVTASGTITAANFIQSGGANSAGWTVGLANPNTVTALGNRSYSLVFNGTDLTSTVSNGMRLRTQRTVAAPTQCTSLNGSTQFYSKTSPAGMTFTDNFTTMGWVKPTSYAASTVISRYSSNGWLMRLNSSGQVVIYGEGTGSSKSYTSYQSVPLNKWTHIAASLNMAGSAGAIYIDGVLVPSFVTGAATVLVQAGNLTVGSLSGSSEFFPGKIAQAAVFSAVLSQATIQSYMSQTLAGTETSLISAYSFNNSINDLNANANNLTANGSAVATNADSPFGGQADGTISSTLDYAIVTKTAFSTNTTLTVQVPEGCTIPTSGGVSAVSYATVKAPYGMPVQRGKWQVLMLNKTQASQGSASSSTWYNLGSANITVPIGEWQLGYEVSLQHNATAGDRDVRSTLSTANNTETDQDYSAYIEGSSVSVLGGFGKREKPQSLSAATPFYLNTETTAAASSTLYNRGDNSATKLVADLAYL